MAAREAQKIRAEEEAARAVGLQIGKWLRMQSLVAAGLAAALLAYCEVGYKPCRKSRAPRTAGSSGSALCAASS